MDDYFTKAQLKKKKDAFKECSTSDCEHLKCNLGQIQKGCTFRPVDEKAEKVKKVAKFIDNIPIIGTGGNRMTDMISYSMIILFGLFFITGKEITMQTPDCESCDPHTIELGKQVTLGYIMMIMGLWSMAAPKNAKIWLSNKIEKLTKPIKDYILGKIKKKKKKEMF